MLILLYFLPKTDLRVKADPKKQKYVQCPDCDKIISSSKDNVQCGNCGTRFPAKENVIKV